MEVIARYPAVGHRSWVFGVLNVTPDSFSDGGRWDSADRAIEHGLALVLDGADVVDVGGESTRPGAARVDAETEAAKVLPVIRALSERGVLCSVDTTRATVAAAAVAAGAQLINDVSGGLADPDMARVAADTGVPWILMHWRGHSASMQQQATYRDVVAEVRRELLIQVDRAVDAGVDEQSLVLDPGLGFAKTSEHNWALLRGLDELVGCGLPVLVGASRKHFLGRLRADPAVGLRPPDDRDAATAAVSLLVAQAGAWAIRVHAPAATRDALAVLSRLRSEEQGGSPASVLDAARPARAVRRTEAWTHHG